MGLWGIVGVAALLGRATWSLAAVAWQAIASQPLAPWQLVAGAGWAALMCYFQGYRGFQRGFSSRVVVRAAYLAQHPRLLDGILAPLFCIGLVRASRPRLVKSWMLVATMVGLVLAVRLVPQPYRGLIDGGVVAGLVWGLAAIAVFSCRAFAGLVPAAALDLPEPARPSALSPVEGR